MRFEYDQSVDALYIRLRDGIVAQTIDVDAGTLVDVDEHGHVLGLEVIHPSRDWPIDSILGQFDVAPEDQRPLRHFFGPNAQVTTYPFTPAAKKKLISA